MVYGGSAWSTNSQLNQRWTFPISEFNSFALEQAAFPIQSARKASEFFVRGQNAMARNQNRNRIRTARAAHGANGRGTANRLRDFA
jgi:hypothetical protein